MVSRKRARDEVEVETPAEEPTTLHKLRNMWHFANLAQYLALFIDALKIDKDLDIEVPALPRCAGRLSGRAEPVADGTNADNHIGPGS